MFRTNILQMFAVTKCALPHTPREEGQEHHHDELENARTIYR